MTILPKKKAPQSSNGAENDIGENSNSGVHGNQLSHHQQLSSNLPNHIQSVGSPGVQEECGALSPRPPPQHYDDDRANGASSPSAAPGSVAVAAHNKRRASYRASPLRSVRPKLREHRVGGGGGGGASPPYTVNPSHPHSLSPHTLPSLSHQLAPLPASSLPPLPPPLSPQAGPSSCAGGGHEDDGSNSGYNSGDEYQPMNWNLTAKEWVEKERWFEKKMKKKGLVIKQMREDGACLFRAIADQVYGDQDMHDVVRKHCMDYLESNEDMFAPFVSENFQTYVSRKRQQDVFGNHIEIAAMSEIYNRVIEVYCYSPEPINIFQSSVESDNPCIRLSYHRGTHYNSLYDPFKPSCGVGLGLPNLVPGLADTNLMKEATRQSENFHIEQAMLEDKIRATDYEATTEAIEEQVANESYLDYLRDIDKRNKAQHRVGSSSSCSSSSAPASSQVGLASDHSTVPRPSDSRNSPPPPPSSRNSPRSSPPHSLRNSPPHSLRNSPPHCHRNSPPHSLRNSPPHSLRNSPPHTSRVDSVRNSPRSSPPHNPRESMRNSPRNSPRYEVSARSSPRGGSSSPKSKNGSGYKSGKSKNKTANNNTNSSCAGGGSSSNSPPYDLAVPGSSKDPCPSSGGVGDGAHGGEGGDFAVDERASFLNHLPPDMFGLSDYSRDEFDVLAQVLAASQQEYLDSLKRNKNSASGATTADA